ncbi:GP133 [Caviid betaherpesvirus 2]|uniref:GP133 n=1 Tax=Guinea pig cytomegalovirus (strain 22122) TaxID=103920 RepID=L7Z8V9_GPCMV|nr:GP133 [Caviid betaherpesvirus 2]AGE11588.1 GP133 [Caviid betaherpesvirus 2]AIL83973.1 GP133 [BAC cloning vector GPN13BACdenovo_preserved(MM)]
MFWRLVYVYLVSLLLSIGAEDEGIDTWWLGGVTDNTRVKKENQLAHYILKTIVLTHHRRLRTGDECTEQLSNDLDIHSVHTLADSIRRLRGRYRKGLVSIDGIRISIQQSTRTQQKGLWISARIDRA